MPLFCAASADAWIAGNGGATTISTPATFHQLTRIAQAPSRTPTASFTVLKIFHLPAIRGMRILDPLWLDRRDGLEGIIGRRPPFSRFPPVPPIPCPSAYAAFSAKAATRGRLPAQEFE